MTRVALYSHDSQGLGHVRRNLALARALRGADPSVQVLLLTGADEAAALPRPAGCDVVGVPGLVKRRDSRYGSRHLELPLDELLSLRAAVLGAALHSFKPEVVVVDRHPRGFGGELAPALSGLPAGTRVVLGLRDVLDDNAAAQQEWAAVAGTEALDRWYTEIWVYGDPQVFDCVTALGLPPHWQRRVRYTGYLAGPRTVVSAGWARPMGAVCLVGGGSDGRPLAEAFARAHWPSGDGLLVLGPQMAEGDRTAVRAVVDGRNNLEVADFVPDLAPRLDGASAAVTMGGYNSVCELISRRVRTLVVPRVRPRREQVVRAERLAALGLLDVLYPRDLTPEALSRWLGRTVEHRTHPNVGVDLDGLRRVPQLMRELVVLPRPREGATHVAV